MPTRGGCYRVEVIDRPTLLLSGDLGVADRPGQPAITLGIAGQHEQVLTLRVGYPTLGRGKMQGQFRSEDSPDAQLAGRFGEAHHPVHPVVISDRDRVQAQPGTLLDQLLRVAGAV
jgi:hypothetical protein